MDLSQGSLATTITLAMRSTPLSLITHQERVAMAAGLHGLALDCSMPFALTTRMHRSLTPLQVHSLWLGSAWLRSAAQHQPAPLIAMAADYVTASVVIDIDGGEPFTTGPRGVIHQISKARVRLQRDNGFLLRLRPSWLVGGRRHLADLTALRHIAEEWDFAFALDLTQPFDPSWEAEAAVMRLGNRLQLFRLTTGATERLAIRQDRVAARALATALDQIRPPTLALVPSVPLLLRASRRAQAEAIARAASAIIQHRHHLRTERAHYLSRGRGPNPNVRS